MLLPIICRKVPPPVSLFSVLSVKVAVVTHTKAYYETCRIVLSAPKMFSTITHARYLRRVTWAFGHDSGGSNGKRATGAGIEISVVLSIMKSIYSLRWTRIKLSFGTVLTWYNYQLTDCAANVQLQELFAVADRFSPVPYGPTNSWMHFLSKWNGLVHFICLNWNLSAVTLKQYNFVQTDENQFLFMKSREYNFFTKLFVSFAITFETDG